MVSEGRGAVLSEDVNDCVRVSIDLAEVRSERDFFQEVVRALEFPSYFGWNWDAMNECFSDYFVLEEGGLGSEFGGRAGIPARCVELVFLNVSEEVLTGGVGMRFLDTVRYTARNNGGRRTADLKIVFQLDPTISDETRARALRSVFGRWNELAP